MKRRTVRANARAKPKLPKNTELVPWTGLKPEPDKYFGFCYLITNTTTGRKYIGKKQYWMAAGKTSRRHTNRQSKQWKDHHWKPSDWTVYTGSSLDLNRDINSLGLQSFTFEIVSQHIMKSELHYAEIDWMVSLDCLRAKLEDGSREYYNKHIGGIKFIPPEYHSPETKKKIKEAFDKMGGGPNSGRKLSSETKDRIRKARLGSKHTEDWKKQASKRMRGNKHRLNVPHTEATKAKIKQHLSENGHPMQGKVHPNKGKKLPQTAPKVHVSKYNIQITNGLQNIWHPKSEPIPKGWRKGLTRGLKKDG